MNTESDNHEVPKLERNIAAVQKVRETSDRERRTGQKFVDVIASFIGSTHSVYLHGALYGTWIIMHFLRSSTETSLSISAERIGLFASLEAIFLTVFVLVNQRRMDAVERKNADLHLQMSLLAEHEITRIAQAIDMIAKRLSIDTSSITDMEEIKREVHPGEILDKISEMEQKQDSAPQSSEEGR